MTGISVILASGSATRRRLLEQAGVAVEIAVPAVDEEAVKRAGKAEGRRAIEVAGALAELKARRVSLHRPEALVLGADQMLVCDGRWFDKPTSLESAADQLRQLRGRSHELVTSVVAVRDGIEVWHHVETARLTMRRFSEPWLESYLAEAGDSLLNSVGAYRLEERGIQLFSRIEGDHFVILGLPLLAVLGYLRDVGVLTP